MLQRLIAAIPLRHQVPLRFWFRRLTGRLEPELALVQRFLSSDSVCVDVGANVGLYTYPLAHQCRFVHAFEPVPSFAEAIRACNLPKVEVHQCALSSRSGTAELYIPRIKGQLAPGYSRVDPPAASQFDTITVSLRCLDEFSIAPVSFLKIDVEGHEREVLKGAADTIERDHPIVLTEIEQRHLSFPMEHVFHLLQDYGYRGFFLYERRLHPLKDFVREIHQAHRQNGSPAARYVNNFLFLHGSNVLDSAD
jgi:FkbM family methyltransferase